MRSTIGDRLRSARDKKEMDQAVLAGKIGVATRTLQRWEKGDQVPAGDAIMKIAKVTNASPTWLLTGGGEMYAPPPRSENIFSLPDTARKASRFTELPLISTVPAGKVNTIFHPDYVDNYVTVDGVKDPGAFALRVKGTSMSPRIEDGDIVIVSPAQRAASGDVCVVRVNEEDTLKKIKIEGNYVHLIPLNPEFEPVTVKKRDVNFIWKVVKLIKEM